MSNEKFQANPESLHQTNFEVKGFEVEGGYEDVQLRVAKTDSGELQVVATCSGTSSDNEYEGNLRSVMYRGELISESQLGNHSIDALVQITQEGLRTYEFDTHGEIDGKGLGSHTNDHLRTQLAESTYIPPEDNIVSTVRGVEIDGGFKDVFVRFERDITDGDKGRFVATCSGDSSDNEYEGDGRTIFYTSSPVEDPKVIDDAVAIVTKALQDYPEKRADEEGLGTYVNKIINEGQF